MSRARFHPNRLVIEIADILRRHGQDYARANAAPLGRVERRVIYPLHLKIWQEGVSNAA